MQAVTLRKALGNAHTVAVQQIRVDTRVQKARHWVAPKGLYHQYMNQRSHKSECRIALKCFNAGKRMNIEHLYKIIIVMIPEVESFYMTKSI